MTAKDFLPVLDAFITEQEAISGYWNGEDDQYVGPDGDVYDEDDAHIAQERADAAKALKAVILQYDI